MEELACVGAVDADLVDLGAVVAEVLDMAEDVAVRVLRHEVAQVGSEAHVGDGGFVEAPGGGGKAFEEDEAFAVEEVGAEGEEAFGEVGEGEVGLEEEMGQYYDTQRTRCKIVADDTPG